MEKEFGWGGIFLNSVVLRDAQKFVLQDKSKRMEKSAVVCSGLNLLVGKKLMFPRCSRSTWNEVELNRVVYHPMLLTPFTHSSFATLVESGSCDLFHDTLSKVRYRLTRH
jgi:hypothetical protein